jgi:DNA (cytosine-5)-methyltransferase 1
MIKYFSLFSGIGGFELGIYNAYVETANGKKNKGSKTIEKTWDSKEYKESKSVGPERGWIGKHNDCDSSRQEPPTCMGYSEIDKYAIKIYQKHFSKHKNYGDITKINPEKLPDFDLLVGGFPCQAFSIAGKRKGFEDTRGTLFFDIARILRSKKPRFFLLENVKGLLSHDNGFTFKTIIATLTELGYDIQWQVLNSKNFGVPQNRERVFIVGHLRETSRPKVFPIGKSVKKDDNEQPVAHAINSSDWRGANRNQKQTTIWTNQSDTQQKRNKSNDTNIVRGKTYTDDMRIRRLAPNTADVHFIYDDYNHRMRTDGNVGTVRATFGNEAMGNGNKVISEDFYSNKIRRLTPLECERLQGFPDGWTDGVSDTQRYKCLGNAVTVNVIQKIIEKLYLSLFQEKPTS